MGDYRQEGRLYRDGNMWCAVGPGFRDLALDKAGFGATKTGAVANLNGLLRLKEKRAVSEFVVGGFCSQCTDWVPEGLDMDGCRDPDCPCNG